MNGNIVLFVCLNWGSCSFKVWWCTAAEAAVENAAAVFSTTHNAQWEIS